MPGDLNRATLIGRLGKDPELRAMGNGKTVATFSIATSDKWKDKNSGQDKETTEWHRITCFRESTVHFLEHYVKKGDQVYVEGAIKTRKWQAQDGSDRYSTEIVITDFNGNVQKMGGAGQASANRDESTYGSTRDRPPREGNSGAGGAPAGGFGSSMDDDIPFYPEVH